MKGTENATDTKDLHMEEFENFSGYLRPAQGRTGAPTWILEICTWKNQKAPWQQRPPSRRNINFKALNLMRPVVNTQNKLEV
jgi:hypothetical protein